MYPLASCVKNVVQSYGVNSQLFLNLKGKSGLDIDHFPKDIKSQTPELILYIPDSLSKPSLLITVPLNKPLNATAKSFI